MGTTLAEDYLGGFDGSVTNYRAALERGNRIGQSFYNALSETDRGRLSGTFYDPFHTDDTESVHRAIEFLLDDAVPHFVYHSKNGTFTHRVSCGCSKKENHWAPETA